MSFGCSRGGLFYEIVSSATQTDRCLMPSPSLFLVENVHNHGLRLHGFSFTSRCQREGIFAGKAGGKRGWVGVGFGKVRWDSGLLGDHHRVEMKPGLIDIVEVSARNYSLSPS